MEQKNQEHLLEFFAYETTGSIGTDLGSLSELLKRADDCLPYFNMQGKKYELPAGQGYGFTSLPVLPWLWGRELNNLTMAYVHSLRPSSVRIAHSEVTTDSRCWRVTILVAPDAAGRCIVQEIAQEVEIGYGCGGDVAAIERHQRQPDQPLPTSGGTIGNTTGLERIDLE